LIVGAALLVWAGVAKIGRDLFQWHGKQVLLASAAPGIGIAYGEQLGRLRIDRLHLDVIVNEGDSDAILDVAAGHLPDTPLPWQGGNSAIAAHRDGLFRPLRDIRQNDVLTLSTPRGTFTYDVTEVRVVRANDLSVLKPRTRDTLTLITCYPFRYFGRAPYRFVVQSERRPRLHAPVRQ
jgi:sortase A